jgi:hypothetical protein
MDSWQPPPLEPSDSTRIMAELMLIDGKLDLVREDIAVIRELLEDDGEPEEDEIDDE